MIKITLLTVVFLCSSNCFSNEIENLEKSIDRLNKITVSYGNINNIILEEILKKGSISPEKARKIIIKLEKINQKIFIKSKPSLTYNLPILKIEEKNNVKDIYFLNSFKEEKKNISNNFFHEDFSSIEEGLFPNNWTISENIFIKIRKGKHTLIANPLKNNHKIIIPDILFPKDFTISLSAKIQSGGIVEMKLSNNIFRFKANSNTTMTYKINDVKKHIKETFAGQKSIFSIRKEGKVFKIYVNGTKKMIVRISVFEKPEVLEINFNDAVNGFEMYKIEGKKNI